MNRRVAARGIFIKDGKLLAVRLKPYGGTGVGLPSDKWCTIGGGVDPGEALIPALEREIVEETGIKPDIGNLLFVQQFMYKDTDQTELFFNITNVDDFQAIDLSKASHGFEEIEEIGFVDPSTTKLLPKFLTEIDFRTYDSNAPTKFYNYL
jgi:8-oxo-dGTP pyrophosphatase MutT (NUDIX family)